MGWKLINCYIRNPEQTIEGNDDGTSQGYLVGTGNEDGYYCFKATPFINEYNGPVISDTYCPQLIFSDGGGVGEPTLVYLNHYAWNSSSLNTSVHYSNYFRDYVRMQGGGLREPYFYTDIDLSTVVGDKGYYGTMPALNDSPSTWEHFGADADQEAATISVSLQQNIWKWNNNGDRNRNMSGFCGRYYNEQDGSWKFVGVPTFKTDTGSNLSAYFRNEKFTRGEKNGRHFVYEGDLGHTIAYSNSKWVVGTIGSGQWSESSSEPSMSGGQTSFTGYKIDPDSGDQVADSNGDFNLTFTYFDLGSQTHLVPMGEISLWRF